MAGHGLGEDRRFLQLQAHIQADDHQCCAEQERNPPAPATELLVREGHGQGQEQTIGGQKTDRGAQLREHAEPGPFAFRCVLGGQQRRAAPFATKAQALAEAQYAQQDRCPGANAVVARQHADQRGTHAHQQQRGDQGRFAPDTVTEMAEQGRAQRAGEEGDAEGEKRREHLCGAGGLREEHRADHQRGSGGVNVEVVELDGGADKAGGGHPCRRVAGAGLGRFGVGAAGRHAIIPDSRVLHGRRCRPAWAGISTQAPQAGAEAYCCWSRD
ncbi:hypothetical protein D3C79_726960 [compost metagenome]